MRKVRDTNIRENQGYFTFNAFFFTENSAGLCEMMLKNMVGHRWKCYVEKIHSACHIAKAITQTLIILNIYYFLME